MSKKLRDFEELRQIRIQQAQVAHLVAEERRRPGVEKSVTAIAQVGQRFQDLWNSVQEELIGLDVEYVVGVLAFNLALYCLRQFLCC